MVHLDAEFASLGGRGQPLRLLLDVLQKLRNPPMKAA
jgi:hypothetical protein